MIRRTKEEGEERRSRFAESRAALAPSTYDVRILIPVVGNWLILFLLASCDCNFGPTWHGGRQVCSLAWLVCHTDRPPRWSEPAWITATMGGETKLRRRRLLGSKRREEEKKCRDGVQFVIRIPHGRGTDPGIRPRQQAEKRGKRSMLQIIIALRYYKGFRRSWHKIGRPSYYERSILKCKGNLFNNLYFP